MTAVEVRDSVHTAGPKRTEEGRKRCLRRTLFPGVPETLSIKSGSKKVLIPPTDPNRMHKNNKISQVGHATGKREEKEERERRVACRLTFS